MNTLLQRLKTGLNETIRRLETLDTDCCNKDVECALFELRSLLSAVDAKVNRRPHPVLRFGEICPFGKHRVGLSCNACSSCIDIVVEEESVVCNEN